jgi:hypothetical protein
MREQSFAIRYGFQPNQVPGLVTAIKEDIRSQGFPIVISSKGNAGLLDIVQVDLAWDDTTKVTMDLNTPHPNLSHIEPDKTRLMSKEHRESIKNPKPTRSEKWKTGGAWKGKYKMLDENLQADNIQGVRNYQQVPADYVNPPAQAPGYEPDLHHNGGEPSRPRFRPPGPQNARNLNDVKDIVMDRNLPDAFKRQVLRSNMRAQKGKDPLHGRN